MITRPDFKPTVSRTQRVLSCTIVLAPLVAGAALPAAHGQADGWPVGAPTLQRMIVRGEKSFAMDYAEPRGIEGRALVVVDRAAPPEQRAVSVLMFGRNLGIVKPPKERPPHLMFGYRWTVSPETTYVARGLSLVEADSVALHIPMHVFAIQPDGTGMLDRTKMAGPTFGGGGKRIPSIGLAPICAYRDGSGPWEEGDALRGAPPFATPPKDIHYDIRAESDERFDLFLTADGRLERWSRTEERSWWLAKRYPVKISGPFLICADGHAAVAEHDGHWCFISPLEDQEPRVQAIVAKQPDVPLLVIEDVFAGKNYFDQEGKVYDENGTTIHTLPASATGPARFEALAEFVRSQRQK